MGDVRAEHALGFEVQSREVDECKNSGVRATQLTNT